MKRLFALTALTLALVACGGGTPSNNGTSDTSMPGSAKPSGIWEGGMTLLSHSYMLRVNFDAPAAQAVSIRTSTGKWILLPDATVTYKPALANLVVNWMEILPDESCATDRSMDAFSGYYYPPMDKFGPPGGGISGPITKDGVLVGQSVLLSGDDGVETAACTN